MFEQVIALITRIAVALEAIATVLASESGKNFAPQIKSAAQDTETVIPAKSPANKPETVSNIVPIVKADSNPFNDPNIELDLHHHYWDEEIHTEVKSKNKDGSWKLKRGIDRELAEQKLKEQTYQFQQAVGRSPTQAAQIAATAVINTSNDEDDGAPLAPPVKGAPVPLPVPKIAAPTKVVRLPDHGNHELFTKEELTNALSDGFVVYGEAFEAAFADWLNQSGRAGIAYTDIDDAAISWFAYHVLEFVRNNG